MLNLVAAKLAKSFGYARNPKVLATFATPHGSLHELIRFRPLDSAEPGGAVGSFSVWLSGENVFGIGDPGFLRCDGSRVRLRGRCALDLGSPRILRASRGMLHSGRPPFASPPPDTAAECLCSKAGVPALEKKHSWNPWIEPVSLVDSGEIKFPISRQIGAFPHCLVVFGSQLRHISINRNTTKHRIDYEKSEFYELE